MAKKSSGGVQKKARVKWTFPRTTLEQALQIADAIKNHHGGNPWEPEEIRKAIGAGTGGNAYFYLTAASRDYGLTTGTNAADTIALTDLGRDIVYAPNKDVEQKLKQRAFLNVDVFNRVLEYYKGSNLPEMKYLGNTLQKEFNLAPETHEEFSKIFRENCQYLGITSGVLSTDREGVAETGLSGTTPGTVILAEAGGASALSAFVIMPFVERDQKHASGFFPEVLRSLISPPRRNRISTLRRQIDKEATLSNPRLSTICWKQI
jgi:hypothetical protein